MIKSSELIQDSHHSEFILNIFSSTRDTFLFLLHSPNFILLPPLVETGSHSVVQAGFEHMIILILLPWPPECWDTVIDCVHVSIPPFISSTHSPTYLRDTKHIPYPQLSSECRGHKAGHG